MRFVAAGDDAIAFVRETADETVLVHAVAGRLTRRCESAAATSA